MFACVCLCVYVCMCVTLSLRSYMSLCSMQTGPYPLAADFSKRHLDCLLSEEFQIGTVSRMQLLLASLVERLHDAIYVVPRYARSADTSAMPPPNPDEYAKDMMDTLVALKRFAHNLPPSTETPTFGEDTLEELLEENRKQMEKLVAVEALISDAIAKCIQNN